MQNLRTINQISLRLTVKWNQVFDLIWDSVWFWYKQICTENVVDSSLQPWQFSFACELKWDYIVQYKKNILMKMVELVA